MGNDIVFGVLSKPGNTASEEMGAAMLKAFRGLVNAKLQGMAVIVRPLSYSTQAALLSAVISQGIDALYVCVGLDPDLPAIFEVTRKRHIVSLASREEQVIRGLSLGVFAIDSKPTIVLNLPASRSEGAAFTTDLLRVAKVIK